MPRIILGGGSAQIKLKVPEIPKVGDKITIKEHQIVGIVSENARMLIGETFILTEGVVKRVKGKKKKFPCFGIKGTLKGFAMMG